MPKVMYQTWKTHDPTAWSPLQRRWVQTWAERNPEWERHFFDDGDCLTYVAERFPEHSDIYVELRPVERADFWRYLIIFDRGGIYTDVDTVCRVPLDDWLRPDDKLVLGVMSDYAEQYPHWRPRHVIRSGGALDPTSPWRDNPVTFTNWTFAAAPGHPLLADIIRRVSVNARDPYFVEEDLGLICKKTGPGVLTDALAEFLAANGTSLNDVAARLRRNPEVVVGSVRLLDYAAFHTRLVVHLGMRSWGAPRRGLDWLVNRVRMLMT